VLRVALDDCTTSNCKKSKYCIGLSNMFELFRLTRGSQRFCSSSSFVPLLFISVTFYLNVWR